MATGTTIDNEWSLKDLTVAVPFVASCFAFAFVVGYFYAFDIPWFAFFSFTEHLVFALRALPIAIGGSVGFLVPNFTEERVKRFARILESNKSLIDDLWQLAV